MIDFAAVTLPETGTAATANAWMAAIAELLIVVGGAMTARQPSLNEG